VLFCHVLRYLKNALDKGLYYRRSTNLDVVSYFDIRQVLDRRSINSNCTFLRDNLVTWSNIQRVLSRYSIEVECSPKVHTACERCGFGLFCVR